MTPISRSTKLKSTLLSTARSLGFQLFPGLCLLCHSPSLRYLDLCRSCEIALPFLKECCSRCALPLLQTGICGSCQNRPPGFTTIITPFLYQFPIDQMIQSFKYSGKLKHGRVLSSLLASHLQAGGQDSLPPERFQTDLDKRAAPSILLPVPMHWRRRLKRGFNQAELIARDLGKRLDIPVDSQIISRTRHTALQENLQGRERRRNLKHAFAVNRPVKDLSIAVIDDVVTTTSTAEEISRCLLRAGAYQVQIWAIARTPLEK